MADLIIRSKALIVSMGGASSVKSASKPSNFALLMFFGGNAKTSTIVRAVNTIVIESISSFIETDYDSISTNSCIGTSIQIHGPPMVDIQSFLHSFTVFTVNSNTYHNYTTNNFLKNISRCG